MSVAQTWLGCVGLNCLPNTLGEIGSACLLSVVWTNLRFHAERSPCWRIKRRKRKMPITTPREATAVRKRRLPYAPPLAANAAFNCTPASHTAGGTRLRRRAA